MTKHNVNFDDLWHIQWRTTDELIGRNPKMAIPINKKEKAHKGGYFKQKDEITKMTNKELIELNNLIYKYRMRIYKNGDT